MKITISRRLQWPTMLILMLSSILVISSAYAGGDERRKRLTGVYIGVIVETNEPVTLSFYTDGNITLISSIGHHKKSSTFLGRWKGKGRSDSNLKYNNVNIRLTSFIHSAFICGGVVNIQCELILSGNLLSRPNSRLTGVVKPTVVDLQTRERFTLDFFTIDVTKR